MRKQAPTVRAGTAAIISRLMAADPDRRFKTPKQLLEALKEVSEFAAEHEVRPLAHKKSLLQRVSAPWFIAQRGSCRRW